MASLGAANEPHLPLLNGRNQLNKKKKTPSQLRREERRRQANIAGQAVAGCQESSEKENKEAEEVSETNIEETNVNSCNVVSLESSEAKKKLWKYKMSFVQMKKK